MSYINFKGTVKKINLKSAEETEITISIPASELDGQYNTLQSMLELKVIGGFDSQIVTYKIMKNALTGKPLTKYIVDNTGVVSVAQPDGEQLAMDLGLPLEKVEIKAEPVQIDLEVIHEFILSGLAPSFDDLKHDFYSITESLSEGETYLKLAADADMGVGVFVVMVDEYRKRVAPLAAKWDEWRTGKVKPEAVVKREDFDAVSEGDENPKDDKAEGSPDTIEPDWKNGGDNQDLEGNQDTEIRNTDQDHVLGEREKDSKEGISDPADSDIEAEVSKEELDAFILQERPLFPEVEYEGHPIPFPDLLEKRLKENKVWREIAIERGMTSGQLSSRYNAYRKLAAKRMMDGGGAA
ncbi:hypothetical protein [Paenibacillus wynnii]|uniref:2-methylcitrate dehydratase n=1 Tax=Paenibacillus wynnii TaxID=268407 RepID=A0A098M6C7_9BACL|nr:hypothetical protein [Paenibacillus wynnii]KGE17588.1 hypothetical protein PWYN_23655 [Paenibacillus wynnii]